MNTRRLLSTFAAVLLLCTLALTGCSTRKASDASSDADLLARIQERGEIVVAMEGTWAPWTYHDENDAAGGLRRGGGSEDRREARREGALR